MEMLVQVLVLMAKMRMAPVTMMQSWKEGSMREMLLADPVGRRDHRARSPAELFCHYESQLAQVVGSASLYYAGPLFSTWFKPCIIEALLCPNERLHWSRNDAARVMA